MLTAANNFLIDVVEALKIAFSIKLLPNSNSTPLNTIYLNMKDNIWKQIESSFKFIHDNLDGYSISKKVDEIGLDAYINRCAGFAAMSGAAASAGGGFTLVIGIPADIANTITQEFKVTLAVIYNRTGRYQISFKEFMKILGLAFGIELGVNGIGYLTAQIAKEIAKRLAAGGFGRVIPLIGALVGGSVNFLLVKSIGSALEGLQDDIFE